MYAQLRRKQMRSGIVPSEAVIEPAKSRAELEVDVACLKERNNLTAIQRGMPAIGAKMVNAHGIEWIVDGHTTAPSMTTLGKEDELYPAVIPQNLSPRLYDFAREIDFCTPKALVPLDTMPRKFPHRGHPGGHWVDAWSEAYRILFFLDIANLHETVYAHELAHVWLDLVMDVEDYRVWKDRSDTPRYSQVQMLQSFVLDQAVDEALRKKGFDLSIVEQDKERANRQLAQAVQSGYMPPTKREAVSLASFLAASIIELEQGTSITRYGEHILAVRSALPETVHLAQNFACAVQDSPPVDRESTMTAVDRVLELAFNETDAGLDFQQNLIVVPPRISYDHDKHPDWIPHMPVRAKCEVGVAMAKTGASAEARWELSDNPAGGLRVRFQEQDGNHTDYTDLKSIDRIPESPAEQIQRAAEMNERNRLRIDNIAKEAQQRSHQSKQQSFMPPTPGGRSYSPGLACWITQVRLEEQLAGEHPYSYALNNPTTYVDPEGLKPLTPCEQAARGYGSPGDSKATVFRKCQSFLESQFDARNKVGWGQICPGGRHEICEACKLASGLPIDCGGHRSCPMPGTPSIGGPIIVPWPHGGGMGEGTFDYWGCEASCQKICPGVGDYGIGKKLCKKQCLHFCAQFAKGGCARLEAQCDLLAAGGRKNLAELCLSLWNAAGCPGKIVTG